MISRIAIGFLTAWLAMAPAQILNQDAPVVVGHYHLNVSSIEEHKKFWVDTLGGTAMKIGDNDVIRFPGVFLFLRRQTPTGPTRGTTLDHIGFAAPDVPKMTTRVVANGYQLTVGREPGQARRRVRRRRAIMESSLTSLDRMA